MFFKFYSVVLIIDLVFNFYICGVGCGGWLGFGDENMCFIYVFV